MCVCVCSCTKLISYANLSWEKFPYTNFSQGPYRFIPRFHYDCLAFKLTERNNTHQLASLSHPIRTQHHHHTHFSTVLLLYFSTGACLMTKLSWERTEIIWQKDGKSAFKARALCVCVWERIQTKRKTLLVIQLWPGLHIQRLLGLYQILSCILPSHNAQRRRRYQLETVFLCVFPHEIKDRDIINGIWDVCVCVSKREQKILHFSYSMRGWALKFSCVAFNSYNRQKYRSI